MYYLPNELQAYIYTFDNTFRIQYNEVIKQLGHCHYCNYGGCGWKQDFIPYWFCSPSCIKKYLHKGFK